MAFANAFPGFRLRLTRWGVVYLVAAVVLGLAAVNTGNNALMALLGLGLGSYVISGTWSRQVLATVEATVDLPTEIYAGRPAVVDVELRNTSGIFPAYGLVVRDLDGRHLSLREIVRHLPDFLFGHGFLPARVHCVEENDVALNQCWKTRIRGLYPHPPLPTSVSPSPS